VIVRIATEGQYEVDDGDVDALNQLDNKAVASCESHDEQAFHQAFTELLEFVRTKGRAVEDDYLGGSDVMLPPPDVSLEEAKAEFKDQGLFPG
jgi:hypothetical protein